MQEAAPAANSANAAAPQEPKKEKSDKPVKYVTLDKVIVMLRRGPNEATTPLPVDRPGAGHRPRKRKGNQGTPAAAARGRRAHALGYTLAEASTMTVEQYAEQLNKTFNASYAQRRTEKPFAKS
jgi:flagellar FliL protein